MKNVELMNIREDLNSQTIEIDFLDKIWTKHKEWIWNIYSTLKREEKLKFH